MNNYVSLYAIKRKYKVMHFKMNIKISFKVNLGKTLRLEYPMVSSGVTGHSKVSSEI